MVEDQKPQNQHYVPQYYFRFFSTDKISICMLLRKNGKVIHSAAIDTQSSKNNFYGSSETESEITAFDTKYAKNHHSILEVLETESVNKLSSEQVNTLIENILFQRERTLTYRSNETPVQDFYKDFFQPQIDDLVNYDSGHSQEATDAVRQAMEQVFSSFSHPKIMQYVNLMGVPDKTDEVSDLKLSILKNTTGCPFIFSDSPVSFTNIALSDYKCSKLGNINLGLIIFFPLSPSLLAFLYDPEAYELAGDSESIVIDIHNEEDVHQINKLQIHEAYNSVYFGSQMHENYVTALWQEEKSRLVREKKSVTPVPEITLNGMLTGRIVHEISHAEPNFYPDLSFIKLKDISNSRIPYRSSFIQSKLPPGIEVPNLNHLVDRLSAQDDPFE
ncbi:DUF4238 domain-containing protein [Pseudomonas farsensis]|uniref:DUF4238 domain-containing protein n=1 Tax=Pseudomonas farsensis TaxID=2745492 RepID=A0ABU8QVK5_9PSED